MSKIIIVAGGAGFIGSHLCSSLLKKGEDVICVDNLSTGSKKNIEELLKKEKFTFIQADTRNEKDVKSLVEENVDEIYDLASPASVTDIMIHPYDAASANSIGTKNLLDLAKNNEAKFLFASSSETYGEPKEHPQKETYWGNVNPVGVRSGYDEGKRFGEALCMAYLREFKTDIKIVRIFNTYGPNSSMDDSRVVPHFVSQALRGESLSVHGDGLQTRSLCYVSDMVNGLIKMMESDEVGPINLGNPQEIKVIDIAKKIITLTSSTSLIKHVERPEDDPTRRKPDISKALKLLNWKPKVELDEGLKMTISYFKQILK